MQSLPPGVDFRDRSRAAGQIARIFQHVVPSGRGKIAHTLASAADPDGVLFYLLRLHQDQPDAFQRLVASDTALQLAAAVFAHSRFLSDELIQHPDLIENLASAPHLYRVRSAEEYGVLLEDWLPASEAPKALSLAVFRRWQLMRILVRDVLGYGTLSDIAEELSNLADAILHITYRRIRAGMTLRYGTPRCPDGGECGFSVLALGKLGGRELNYSSDIDLMFLYTGNGETDGPQVITNKELFKKIANQYTDLLSTYTAEGLCYRVDLRLRPDGRLGEVCLSLDGAKNYYQNRARDWELQMLIKARVAAGEPEAGRELLDFVEPRIYSSTLDFSAVESVSATRERIHEKLAARRMADSGLDVKLTRGGIRDVEFLVQCLQRLHGGREPWVRHAGTLLALLRLRDKDLLSSAEYARLAEAYQFLRFLEHRLQAVEDRQTHTLPSDPNELELLARRMPSAQLGRRASGNKLVQQLNAHLENVQETYDRVIHAQQPLYYTPLLPPVAGDLKPPEPPAAVEASSSNLVRLLDKRAPRLAAELSRSGLKRGIHSFEHFLEKIQARPDLLALMDRTPELVGHTVDLFENSPHFADELIREPELIQELAPLPVEPDSHYRALADRQSGAAGLRRFFRREMLRIQAESVCLKAPIFDTLARTSDLADAVVCAVYKMAIADVLAANPPANAGYLPAAQMMVIAMGRLGMREFDLGSDADLNFVLPDEDADEMRFWTRVANRMIAIISSYTGGGVMFTVDTRLRPNGREGTLVQTAAAYKEYLSKNAEAWEGITYMKSRALAGNAAKATQFLYELQEVDWRRYGQSGRSRGDLRAMRLRLEKEQGANNPLKAGIGGYYDIDFALMYLRLKSAGIFYKVLNTPERIDVIEKMGHLDHEDAKALLDGATFYRAVDHGLRVYSGHAEGRLPQAQAHLEALTNLVCRWTPGHLHDQPLPVELAQIQERTREYFKRLFG